MLHDVFFWMFNGCIRLTVLVLLVVPVRKLLKKVSARMCYFFWSIIPASVLIRVLFLLFHNRDAVSEGVRKQNGLLFLPDAVLYLLEIVWLIGMVVKLSSIVLPYIKLKRYLVGSICVEENVYVSDRVTTPFSIGLFAPKIYLPAGLNKAYYSPVIMHEKVHIARKDLWVKNTAVFFTVVFWFCPIWSKACDVCIEDMEAACDEAVICRSSDEFKRQYAKALVMVSGLPDDAQRLSLGCGREAIEERIGYIMGYGKASSRSRRKAFGIVIASGLLLLSMMVLMPNVIAGAEVQDAGMEQREDWDINNQTIDTSKKK